MLQTDSSLCFVWCVICNKAIKSTKNLKKKMSSECNAIYGVSSPMLHLDTICSTVEEGGVTHENSKATA